MNNNDILIMASDGVFDNLFDNDLAECVKPYMASDGITFLDPQASADCIAQNAQRHGLDENYNSPFAVGAKKDGKNWLGGKLDDISVIVAQILTTEKSTVLQEFESNGTGIDTITGK